MTRGIVLLALAACGARGRPLAAAADREACPAADRFELLDIDPRDAGGRWPVLAPPQEIGNSFIGAFGLELDGAIHAILHPPSEPEAVCLVGGGGAVRDALNSA